MCSILLTFLNVFGVLGSTLSLGAAHPDALFSLCEFKCNTQRCKHTEQLLQVERICGQLELVGAYDVKGGERSTALWLTQWQSRPRTHTEYSEKQWNCTFWDPAVKASILHSLGKLINRLDFHRQGKEDEVCFQEKTHKRLKYIHPTLHDTQGKNWHSFLLLPYSGTFFLLWCTSAYLKLHSSYIPAPSTHPRQLT